VNGSAKRMRELQALFEAPPRYGKSLDWKQSAYTPHDVASVFRRYLTQMPEPVIPYDMYHSFRDSLAKEPFNQEEVITTYKQLIRQMHRANQYLLLYVLDLLSVFARKSDKNLMNATNLAVIFRPGLLSHPDHELNPKEHALGQKVLEFLIAQQDWFMLDIPPPPPNEPGSPRSAMSEDDVTVFPSDDEHSGGGWKLVRDDRVSRRKTQRSSV
jgi:GTPase-activating protein SAC7